jgi:ketosteroid isomerase-like protein
MPIRCESIVYELINDEWFFLNFNGKCNSMKKITCSCLFIFFSLSLFSQSPDETAIKKAMTDQVNAWNLGNIDNFMKGYWQSDSLTFIGKAGVTYGYTNTLNNYKKNYDSPAKMGKLFFSDLVLKRLSADYYFITGKWFLKRDAGDIGGYYTLLFHKIKGQWLIVVDHTS